MKQAFLFLLLCAVAPLGLADERSNPEAWSPAKLAVIGISAAALTSWGAYEIGDTPEDGQRNVRMYWGIGLVGVTSMGMEARHRKNQKAAIGTDGKSLFFAYRF